MMMMMTRMRLERCNAVRVEQKILINNYVQHAS